MTREDGGTCIVKLKKSNNQETPEAHEMGYKGAITDALKRAFHTFGAQFANGLERGHDDGDGEREAAPRPSSVLVEVRKQLQAAAKAKGYTPCPGERLGAEPLSEERQPARRGRAPAGAGERKPVA